MQKIGDRSPRGREISTLFCMMANGRQEAERLQKSSIHLQFPLSTSTIQATSTLRARALCQSRYSHPEITITIGPQAARTLTQPPLIHIRASLFSAAAQPGASFISRLCSSLDVFNPLLGLSSFSPDLSTLNSLYVL